MAEQEDLSLPSWLPLYRSYKTHWTASKPTPHFLGLQNSFYWNGVDVEYSTDYNCSSNGCYEDGICRCGTIYDTHITDIDESAITTHILTQIEGYFIAERTSYNQRQTKQYNKELKEEVDDWLAEQGIDKKGLMKKLYNELKKQYRAEHPAITPPPPVDPIELSPADKLGIEYLVRAAIRGGQDVFTAEVTGGYYGEEIEGITLDTWDELIANLETLLVERTTEADKLEFIQQQLQQHMPELLPTDAG